MNAEDAIELLRRMLLAQRSAQNRDQAAMNTSLWPLLKPAHHDISHNNAIPLTITLISLARIVLDYCTNILHKRRTIINRRLFMS